MKRFLFFAMALSIVFAACSKGDELAPLSEEKVEIVFEINSESAIKTRAISDGKGANQLFYGVFNQEGELIMAKAEKGDVKGLTDGYTMTISLVKGHTYQVVFWAQNSASSAYTISDDMKVTVDYEGINNDESRDAFFGKTEKFTVEGASTINVLLKRPFAQVNVGAFPFDFEHAKDMGVDISRSSATYTGVANQIDLLTGEATGEVEVNYTLGVKPDEQLFVDVDENDTNETYEWLSMSYLLANSASTLHSMSFQFADTDGNNIITFADGLSSIPIQRNYRTNIVGQILTGAVSFNIKIDPVYEGESINSAGLYYNFSEDTTIADKVFAFNTTEAATFTSENNNLITMNNVTFSGKVEQIAMGEYRDKGNYVEFRNHMTNVVAKDMVVTHPIGIENVPTIDYMSPLFFLRGVTTLKDCVITGTTSVAPDKQDYNGDMHPVIAYDCGVPNFCDATFDNCTVDALYAWSHSQITLKDTKVKYIRCSTHDQSYSASHMTIDAGSVVDEIVVTSTGTQKIVTIDGKKTLTADNWAPKLIIKSGAHVKVLNMNGRSRYDNNGNLDVIIEDDATVDSIINEDTSNVPTTPEP